ncbi:GntR family transcriptional regulator [Nocardioides speluncae]|uniref:GntR family transcriptional regulator n=1 Tax=Nocardioides speluncae TaxID=2670337 RepID=UPI00137A1934|nr:GntR family transcriptional regulator [Nocardioides speluncae]
MKKYQQIAEAIRTGIRDGEFRPGDQLPAETVLAERHQATVPTVRQAKAVLQAEGLIESRHGIGTFVREESRLQRRSRSRYGEARGRSGLLTDSLRHDIVSARSEPAPARIADVMGIELDEAVVVRRRDLYDESDQLQEIGASYLPVEFAAGTYLAEPDVVPKALFLCVEEVTKRRYATATDHWVARPATPDECDRFGIAIGAYVLHVIHVARDEGGDVLEVSESIWPADRVRFIDEYDVPSEPTSLAVKSDV